MEATLRLVEDGGIHWEIQRLQQEIADRGDRIDRLVHTLDDVGEDLRIARDTVAKYHRESTALKGQLKRYHAEDSNDPLVVAVIDFWRALRQSPRLARGPERTRAILGRLKDDPPAEPKDFIYPTLGIVLNPTPKKNGVDYHDDIEVAVRSDVQLYKWRKVGVAAVDGNPRKCIEELGGEKALEALDRLLTLQESWGDRKRKPPASEAA